jgi:apolipoprotein N-acyltransferase
LLSDKISLVNLKPISLIIDVLNNMDKRKLYLLALMTGILLTPAWYSWGSGLFLLFAFVPLLYAADIVSTNPKPGKRVFYYAFIAFLVWNVLSTWWIKNASFAGMIVAVLLNSFLMAGTFWLYFITKKKTGNKFGYFSLLIYWVCYEYFYLHAEISWTWLNLGNGFANDIRLIQWYEYTGTLGGTLWVLLVNIIIYQTLVLYLKERRLKPLSRRLVLLAVLLLFPIGYSMIRFHTYKEKHDPYEIVVIQPNIDPYEKFNDIPPLEQMSLLTKLADSLTSSSTDYIVAPETFINNNLWLDRMEENPSIIALRNFHKKYPQSMIVIGATAYQLYKDPNEATATSRRLDQYYYDSFNTSLQLDSTGTIPFYHKSQLVVGVEKMPYPDKLAFLKKLMLNLGGTFRSHGTQDYRDAFVSTSGENRVAPVICYESIFGEYVTDYISNAGANLIFVITNDGWWGDTPGYVQHNSFSSLRAIETRRSIARSANTGISSFINQKGEILQTIGWWKQGVIIDTLNANDKITFYVSQGDYIGRVAAFFSFIGILYLLVFSIMKRKA